MLFNLFSIPTYDIGIDLGTANTRIGIRNRGVLFTEPSVVAINKNTKEVLAVGSSAKEMLGRTPSNISAIRPLKDGVIVDFEITEAMISYFLKKSREKLNSPNMISKPRVLVGVPSSITEVEKQAVLDATLSAGARESFVIKEPMAAAIGEDMPINEPIGNMLVDIGGGTTDIVVISLGEILVDKTIKIAGDEMDEHIVAYIKDKYQMLIGRRTAEQVKINIGSAFPIGKDSEYRLYGRDLNNGMPKAIKVKSSEIREAITQPIKAITESVKDALEDTPPELISDIYSRGILITGGGSNIVGIDKLWEGILKVPIRKAKKPLYSVLFGTLKALGDIVTLRKLKEDERKLI